MLPRWLLLMIDQVRQLELLDHVIEKIETQRIIIVSFRGFLGRLRFGCAVDGSWSDVEGVPDHR